MDEATESIPIPPNKFKQGLVMNWDYRVIKTQDPETDEDLYEIYEVYYSDTGDITYWSERPESASGDTLNGLKDDLMLQLKALEQPVLVEYVLDGKATLSEKPMKLIWRNH